MGGYLNISYDGERLGMFWVASLPDNNRLAKKLMEKKDRGEIFSSTPGEVRIGEDSAHILFSSRGITYEIHDHKVQFRIDFENIPCVVNEAQTFDILMVDFSPDSAIFSCTGKELMQHVEPKPVLFAAKQARWTATDTSLANRHSEYLIELTGSGKGAFGFSRLSLRQQNQIVNLFWDDVFRYILIVFPFWQCWYWLLIRQRYFQQKEKAMVQGVIKWLPWLIGFYGVIVLDRFVSSWEAMSFIKMKPEQFVGSHRDGTLSWRIVLAAIGGCLWWLPRLLGKRLPSATALLIRSMCRTLS
ncbi:MAG: hypothetical protein ABUM51_08125, partial [Bacteroidota bacterium]